MLAERIRRVANRTLVPPANRLPAAFESAQRSGTLDAVLTRFDRSRRMPGRAIDVGANVGFYAYAFSHVYDAVEAFEPQPDCVRQLTAFAAREPRLRVHTLALSDAPGKATLSIPLVRGRWRTRAATGLGSLTPPPGFALRDLAVELATLDSFAFDDVGLIKIDVEGHEAAVLAGARQILQRCGPALIVEIEERHTSAAALFGIFASLADLGYHGSFLRGPDRLPLADFHLERDQRRYTAEVAAGVYPALYANNFLFEKPTGPRVPWTER